MKQYSNSIWTLALILCLLHLVTRTLASKAWEDAATPNYPRDASFSLLHIRRQEGLSSTNHTQNNTLLEAEKVLKAAQVEARTRNKYLVDHVRKNKYEFRTSRASQEHDNKTGTGVNTTIAKAAAIVTESLAKNETQILVALTGRQATTSYWMANMIQNGGSPYAGSSTYKVWRNVRDYGATGDGSTDDTAAINRAITDGNRCGAGCGSSSTLQAVVYFPPGIYIVSASLEQYYFTQFIGDPLNRPTIKAKATFVGLGVISSDKYIEGGDSAEWYINQSNFYRQIRNLIIDISDAPKNAYIAAIHWQVAQATSLQNIKFVMSTEPGNNQQGIFMENGSGGFLSDLEFSGGSTGMYVGNQQFSVRNLKFSNHQTQAIQIHWDWGWTWKGIEISNCPVGIVLSTPGALTEVGSAIFIDSIITNCPVGIRIQTKDPKAAITLSLFSLSTTNVPLIVKYDGGTTLLTGSEGSTVVVAWGMGKRYDTSDSGASGIWQDGTTYPRTPLISGSLLRNAANQQSGFFERSKPQYENVAASNFINVKLAPYNAVGDGSHDDTAALNTALSLSAVSGKIVWIPAGVYLISDTVFIPSGAKVVGQSWAQIMGSGVKFQDISHPYPVVKVGNVGDFGSVEIQDLLFTVRGKTAGAILLQWNIHESTQGSAAMWDTHIRVGGAKGSDLQVANCPKLTGAVNPNCIAASVLVHVTSAASAYFENAWFWVADHDLDIPEQTQIDIFVGRGVLIESYGPVWLYGTASEHCVLYQYQTLNAANIFMGMIQTESPYFQVTPPAPIPFEIASGFTSDPSFAFCDPTSRTCAVSWAVRIVNTRSVYIYGAGLYSWFSDYSQTCLDTESCQDRIMEVDSSSDVWIYSLITKASVEMISPIGGVAILGKDNKLNFCSVVMAWLGSAESWSDAQDGVKYRSPISATVIPFFVTTVAATATFTIEGPVVTIIDATLNEGNQNNPKGPGSGSCSRCDLARLITSTCCGTGGGVSNPLLISPSSPIPRNLILPAGFIPNQQITDQQGTPHKPGQPLSYEIVVPVGTSFPYPLVIPPGLSLSDRYTPGMDDEFNSTMYIITTFWEGPLTISCSFPCTIVFPPYTTTTTYTPDPFLTLISGTNAIITPPVQTSKLIRISKATITSSTGGPSRKTFAPLPALKPLCIKITIPIIGTISIGFCPPDLSPFPPEIPTVTIIPLPPGGKRGPINPYNLPSPGQTQEEEEEEEEEEEDEEDTCPLIIPLDEDFDDDYGTSPSGDDDDVFNPAPVATPGPGSSGGSGDTDNPVGFAIAFDTAATGAGTGLPITVIQTVTVTPPSVQTTVVVVVTPTSPPVTPPAPPPANPAPPTPDPNTETSTCFKSGRQVAGGTVQAALDMFCSWANGYHIKGNALKQGVFSGDFLSKVIVSVLGKNNCEFTLANADCRRILNKVVGCRPGGSLLRIGGTVESNCAVWTLDPQDNFHGECIPIPVFELFCALADTFAP